MTYLDTNARSTKTTGNEQFQQLGRFPSLFGAFIGFVKRADDVQKNGRLQVWIPELGSPPTEEKSWITVNYCSPFAGATNVESNNKNDTQSFEGTQTSYGMWMIPPDINNQVLVIFIGGDPSRGVWLGSMYNQFMNNMVPGMAADTKNYQYPGKAVPVAEYNKWDTKVTQPDKTSKPNEVTKFKGVGNQGLITDQGRGITTSSARRESPSSVFGILTPGPAIDSSVAPDKIRRKGGSSFIMDDGTGSEYVQLTTKSGAQIRIDETNGFVYLINRDGTSWIQLDQLGHIDIFSQFDISLRGMRDINFRADRNINMEAGQNVFISAAKDTVTSSAGKPITYDINNVPKNYNVPWFTKVARGQGEGGNIVFEAQWDMHTTVVQNNLYTTTKAGKQEINSKLEIDVLTNDSLNIKVTKNIITEADGSYQLQSPTITFQGATKIRGSLAVTGAVNFGSSLGVASGFNAASGSFSGDVTGKAGKFATIPGVESGGGASPGAGPGSAGPGVSVAAVADPVSAALAELKGLIDAGDILPEIKTPYFTRGIQTWPTIVSRWPTYEPCPLHEEFKFSSTTGYTPPLTEGDKTYDGSAGPANPQPISPKPNTDQGANNTVIPAPDTQDSVVSKDFNMAAFQCQLKVYEGYKEVVYLDSKGLPTAGIGHLLRANEQAPVGTPVSVSQIDSWFQADTSSAIKIAQSYLGIDCWGQLSDNRKRAVADLCYNMGGKTINTFKTFKAKMQAFDFNAAGDALKNSLWYTQVKSRGPKIVSQIVNDVDPNGCDKKFPA